MSVVKGKLQSDLEMPGISGLVHYLTDQGRLHIQFLDNDKNTVAESGACSAVGNGDCGRIRERLIDELLETHQPCHSTCPAGASISALPIMHSSALFGGVIVCELSAARVVGHQQTVSGVDPLVNSLSILVAQDSFHEMEVESLTSDLSLRYEELALLYELGERIPIRAETPTVIEYVVEGLREVIRCDAMCWIPDGEEAPTVYWCRPDHKNVEIEGNIKRIAKEIDRRVKDKEGVVTVNNLWTDGVLTSLAEGVSAASGYPVATDGEHYGTLVLLKFEESEFKSGEAMLASAVARRSGTVIRNAKLYHELNDLFLSTIKTLVRVIEGKDAYTRGHSERVSAFSMLLADLLQLPLEEKEALSWSSLLHDIGKIKIPEEILKKPGKLTGDEFAVIQQHPVFGAEMLAPIGQLAHCLPDIRHHHERVDGGGYPDGLAGDAIPLRAKIIAVADTFDALTSDRCYRPRFGIDKAVQIVEEVAGTQLYSEAAATLVANKDAFLEHVQSVADAQPANAEQARES
jgi:HD-GYP domain-containing protein (c-di-GMP phosphodiesterase class II)